MASINLGMVSDRSYPAMSLKSMERVRIPGLEEIAAGNVAKGRREIGEKAWDAALKQLEKLLHHKDIQVSTSLDTRSGLRNMVLTDGATGKTIIKLPPTAVIEIAEKARQNHVGWIIDLMA